MLTLPDPIMRTVNVSMFLKGIAMIARAVHHPVRHLELSRLRNWVRLAETSDPTFAPKLNQSPQSGSDNLYRPPPPLLK
jgi:hypothetical protein